MAAEIRETDVGRIEEQLNVLAAIRETDAGGWTRRALTEAATAGRDEVARRMREVGLECSIDGAGNLVGFLAGRNGGTALVTGSHTDTVHGGGRYDGVVGVLGAIEAVRTLQEADVQLAHDLLVVDFYGEEANDFGLSCLGSRALAGNLDPSHLQRTDVAGRTLADAMATSGIDPNGALSCRWDAADIKAFVELHIEQGPVLEGAGCPIGIVSAIAAIARGELTFHGRRDHAGTMPVDLRHDAACAAAEAVLAVERLGRDGGVATAGQLTLHPGAANVVPDNARLTVEFRSTDPEWLLARQGTFEAAAQDCGARRGVDVDVEWISGEPHVQMSRTTSLAIAKAAGAAGYPTMTLPSGAGHDTVQLARLTDVGMIFVPSAGGRSHCPEEFTAAADVSRGVRVLAHTLRELDQS